MTADLSPELRRELLDDFYAECDEQLSAIRDRLVELDGLPRDAPVPAASVEPLFRNVHSFKGNASIVGLRPAEELAHAAEDYLRGLMRAELPLSDGGIEALLGAMQRLEQIVSAHRRQHALPPTDGAVAKLAACCAQRKPASEFAGNDMPRPESATEASVGDGHAAYRFTFSPTRELDARGVNVNAVRARLEALGRIVSGTPHIRAGGAVVFEFVVESTAPLADAAVWEADGISVARVGESSAEKHAPAAGATAADQAASLFIAPSHIVRVDLSRLDDLMRITGELVIHRSRLDDRLKQSAGDQSGLKEVNLALTRSLRELREAITRVRLVPVAEIFARMPLVVRDLVRESGKKARLLVEGQHTQIDKYLVERLKEPLLHLVRNALSHGIETVPERVAAGKPPEGTIVLSAAAVGEAIVIQVRDDGRGLDPERLAARAAALNLPVPAEWDDAAILALICRPGFSTRDEADLAAGRGVGMDAVRATLRELGGQLAVKTSPQTGTAFTLRLPLTLSIVETLIVSVAGQICAVPQSVVQEVFEMTEDQAKRVNHAEAIPYRGGLLPIVRLHRWFGAGGAAGPARKPVLVIRSDRGLTGIVADRVIAQREVVVRPMADALLQVRGVAGATELGDGRPVLILDAPALAGELLRSSPALSAVSPETPV